MLISPFIKNEVVLMIRAKFKFFLSYVLFTLMVFIFPLSFSYDSDIINYFLPVIIWISVIMSSLISIEYIYREEYENGYIEYLALSSKRLILVLYSKILVGWAFNGFPISIISSLLFLFFTNELNSSICLAKTLIPGTLTIHCLGCLG